MPWSFIASRAASNARARASSSDNPAGTMMNARPAARVAAVAPYEARCTSNTPSIT